MFYRILLSILLAAGLGVAARAQEEAENTVGEEAVEEEVLDPLKQLTEPGEHHEHLDRLAGDWDLTIRVWTSPDGEPVEAAGTAEARWILGGRFLWTIYRAQLFGQPFEAWSIEGYDNQAKQYVGTWRDTQGTYTLVYQGRCRTGPPPREEEEGQKKEEEAPEPGPEGSFRQMSTTLTDPVSGEKLDIRTELRILDDGGFIQESFIELSDEESLKNLEIVGRRRGEG